MEQSAVVWHPAITKGGQRDIERTQKVALKVILGKIIHTMKIYYGLLVWRP